MQMVRSKIPDTEMVAFRKTMVPYTDTQVSGSLEGALTNDEVKYLIGKKGKHFKQITKEANVSFIWYDENNHSVVIWGPQENLNTAVQLLYKQIEKIKTHGSVAVSRHKDVEMAD
jgi:phosphate starvation-inducible protein PhoH